MAQSETINKPLLTTNPSSGTIITDKDIPDDIKKKYKTNRLNETIHIDNRK
jgi:hypothetical protein